MGASKILVADDEPLNLLLYSEMLKSAGHIIITATDGLDAIEHAKKEKPDIVILDWNMPRLDGLEALKELKKDPEFEDVPVVMITGIMTSPDNLKVALEAGAMEFLRKPFEKTELNARVNSMLLLSQSRRDLQAKYRVIEDSNSFITSVIGSIPHPIVYYDLVGLIQGFNESFEKSFIVDKQEIIGSEIYSHFFNPFRTLHLKKDEELKSGNSPINYECSCDLLGKDYIFTKALYRNSVNDPIGILCIMTDITEVKQAHAEIMEIRKRELTSSALRLIQITEMNNKLISELNELNKFTNRKGGELIRKLLTKFNDTTSENTLKEFETRFERVYESFYKSLNARFPDLTANDLKLCAFLRLNLSTKDIAAITFQNPQSIDMARYRLRKKLNLQQEDNLTDFLMNIE